jgi:hypothetical protein
VRLQARTEFSTLLRVLSLILSLFHKEEVSHMYKILISGVIITVILTVLSCEQEPSVTSTPLPAVDGYKEISKNDISFKWKIDGANLKVIVRAPTTGWVSVGFNPTRMMQDANIIIGYVKDNQVFMKDDYGTGSTTHQTDTELGGLDNILEKSGKEVNGYTELSFTIPLNSGDSKDQALTPGQAYKIILGYGPNDADDFKTFHKEVTSVKIIL